MFTNSTIGERIRKSFGEFKEPKEPFKRKLTEEESTVMFKHFKNHSWSSNVDADGNIILSGGDDSAGKYYITEDDLKKVE